MAHSIASPPRTIMEAFQSLPQGTLAELIDNVIYMSPSPTSRNQIILNEINFKLLEHLKTKGGGMIYIAPMDVYLDEKSNAVQPDIIFVRSKNLRIVDPNGHIHGIPDLLIEILSQGNKEHDLVKKKELYQRFGVKEYWVIDPESKLALGYHLKDDKYALRHEEIGSFKSPLLDFEFQF